MQAVLKNQEAVGLRNFEKGAGGYKLVYGKESTTDHHTSKPRAGKPFLAYEGIDYHRLAKSHNLTFNGLQKRINATPVPLFTDNETGSTFMFDEEHESLVEAAERIRTPFRAYGKRNALSLASNF